MRRIGAVTCARSDLGIYLPVFEAIREHEGLALEIVATGMHLSSSLGRTVDQLGEHGFEAHAVVESLLASDSAEAIGKSMGLGLSGFAQLFSSWRPDILLVLGDRFDMFPAVAAALPHCIPVAHIHGGELSEGAIDDSIRHCITKLSHLHFTSTREAAGRVMQLGEEIWRVTVSGAPGIDRVCRTPLLNPEELRTRFGVTSADGFLLVTFHPETLSPDSGAVGLRALLQAIEKSGRPSIFTYPNADSASRRMISDLESYCARHANARFGMNAGESGYLSLMKAADAMLGNSSSGIIEAASFELPVVNVGERQRGRQRAANVIDCGPVVEEIAVALEHALSPKFRRSLVGLRNPYGDGEAAQRITKVLATVELGERLLRKKFFELDPGGREKRA